MPRTHRHTRSDNLTPNENLERFLTGHVEFLRREKRRIETFFRENGITGEDLEVKLRALETIIEERGHLRERIRQLQTTQRTASRLIRELYNEKMQFLARIQELEQENTQLCRDLEYEQAINGRTINNLRNQVNTLENRENIFTAVLSNQGQVIPRLHRQEKLSFMRRKILNLVIK
ncbi:2535_t:CDS:2 [Dentiscutata erythropus]|uniref:2535_t:CDS:1 n=1 Tax=Dentiscutata erythropus TaxID=1348616 RepID=A0A9N9C3Q8_9GLOM|nr:2535_t:CDS:2 [Dentiscutata erythropus]